MLGCRSRSARISVAVCSWSSARSCSRASRIACEQAETTGRLALVGGEAGVGKTSLARSFVESCPDGFRVLWGACDPLSTPRPLAPFQDMAPFAALLEERQGRHGLLTALLDELAVHTVMVVEDAHWADEATLEALRFVGRRVTGTRSS